MTTATVDGESVVGSTIPHPRPTAVEMDRRAELVLALLPTEDSQVTSLDVQNTLGLTEPQTETLIAKMLRQGQMHTVGKIGKRRLFSRGPGTRRGAQMLEPISPVTSASFLRKLKLGDYVQVKTLRLLDQGVQIQFETPEGPVTLTALS